MQGLKARWLLPEPMPVGYDAPLKHLSPIVAQILYNRGITHEELPAFLQPEAGAMHAGILMRGMADAVRRIRAAIAARERIAIYGDFDVDGITGSVLLYDVLGALGADRRIYIPDRKTEGYGLNTNALDLLHAEGVTLVVTVDCGISCADEVDYARGIGMDVIITDHHLPPPRIPDCLAVLNPRQPLCGYPFKDLAGVGVAFKLASVLSEGIPNGHRLRHSVLDLVVVGTIADMVPLRGENRILVRYGLRALSHTTRVGLRALLRRAGLDHTQLTTADVGYKLGPRLNAAGRIDHASLGCQLLLTEDAAEADRLAETLEGKNDERQRLTADIIAQAQARIGPRPAERALLIDDDTWPGGVIGLVAGRLAERYCRPVLVVERATGESRGSARSIPGFNIIEALQQCRDILTKYGGHAQAAGFSLETERIPDLRARIADLAAARLREEDLVPSIQLDAEIGGRDFAPQDPNTLYEQLRELEPFGVGNMPPVLLWRNMRVTDCRILKDSHVRFSLSNGNGTICAIAFGQARDIGLLPRGTAIDVVATLQYNDWNGYSTVELRVKDVAVKGGAHRGIDHISHVSIA